MWQADISQCLQSCRAVVYIIAKAVKLRLGAWTVLVQPSATTAVPRVRPPLPAAFTRQRRGWATRHLVVESEPGADSLLAPGGGSAGAAPAGTPSGSASQSMRLWTASSTPRSWVWGGGAGGGMRGRVPPRQSTCQLELDASVEHILNREQVAGRGCLEAGPVSRDSDRHGA